MNAMSITGDGIIVMWLIDAGNLITAAVAVMGTILRREKLVRHVVIPMCCDTKGSIKLKDIELKHFYRILSKWNFDNSFWK